MADSAFNSPVIPGDLDGDGDVDSADRTIMVQNWTGALQSGGTATLEQGDLDGDGDVDTADLTLFTSNWSGAQASTSAVQPFENSVDQLFNSSSIDSGRPSFWLA